MTEQELLSATAKINELETEAAEIRRNVHEAIEGARRMNEHARNYQARLRVIDEAIQGLRAVVKKHLEEASIEAKRLAAQKAAEQNLPVPDTTG